MTISTTTRESKSVMKTAVANKYLKETTKCNQSER